MALREKFKGPSQVLLQLAREFWLPLVAASLWSAFSQTRDAATIASTIGRFTTAFFFAAWLGGQFFRVSKQVRTETSLQAIVARLESVTSKLDDASVRAEGWAKGGDSYAYLEPAWMTPNSPPGALALTTAGDFPLRKVRVRIVDIDRLGGLDPQPHTNESIAAFLKSCETERSFDELEASHIYHAVTTVHLGDSRNDRRFNVFYSARNGGWVQKIRFRFHEGRWHFATKVQRPQDNEYTVIHSSGLDGFPNPETADWD